MNKNKKYGYFYSLGIGKNSKIYAENNVADIEGRDYKDFIKVFGGKELTTVNNIFNGQKIDKFDESLIKVDWAPMLYQKIDATNEVKDKVLNNAGVFKNKM